MNSIGIFDSGVGGISVLREIRRLMPNEHLNYVADSAHLPYGNKTPEHIVARAHIIVSFLLDQGAKAIVVACNTATAAAIGSLRATYNIPIVGMEPAVKPAAALTKTGVIAILATAGTLKSEKFDHLHHRFGSAVSILRHPCEGWVEQVETGDLTSKATYAMVKNHVQPLLDKKADTLVLGCTHYPFLTETIRGIAGPDVHILETGSAVSRQLKRRLEGDKLLNTLDQQGQVRFWSSSNQVQVQLVMARLWGEPIALGYLPTETDSR